MNIIKSIIITSIIHIISYNIATASYSFIDDNSFKSASIPTGTYGAGCDDNSFKNAIQNKKIISINLDGQQNLSINVLNLLGEHADLTHLRQISFQNTTLSNNTNNSNTALWVFRRQMQKQGLSFKKQETLLIRED